MIKVKEIPSYNVLSRKGTLRQVRKYASTARTAEAYQKAYKNLEDSSMDVLIKRHVVSPIGKDYYLYRVDQKNRLIFKQQNNNRYIVALGSPDQIKRQAMQLRSRIPGTSDN